MRRQYPDDRPVAATIAITDRRYRTRKSEADERLTAGKTAPAT
jgi:hypothetical protein